MGFKANIFLVFSLPCLSSAQSLTPQLIGSTGQSANVGANDVEWSVGEPVIGPFDSVATTTHGFQQLDEQLPTPVVAPAAGLSQLRVQRTRGTVKILFNEARAGYEVRLFSGQGRNIGRFSVTKGQKELSIPTRELAQGEVLLHVMTLDRKQVQSFKFIGGDVQ